MDCSSRLVCSFLLVLLGTVFRAVECDGPRSSLELQSVYAVIRHGDRSPTDFYPNDPFKEAYYWPEGIGALNGRGVRRLHEAGRIYRQEYGNFLSATNGWPKYAKSSTRERCVKSARIFLESFLSSSDNNSNASLVDGTRIKENAKMLTTSANCPASNRVWLSWFNGPTVNGYIQSKVPFIRQLEKLTGAKYITARPYTIRNIEFLTTTLEIERDEYGLDVPAWARNESIRSELSDIKQHAYLFDWAKKDVQRLRGGLLLKDVWYKMSNLRNFSTTLQQQRMYLYFTHDVNLVILLQALSLYTQINNWPPSYASAIVLEHYRNASGEHYVRMIYREVLPDPPSTPFTAITNTTVFAQVDHPLIVQNTELHKRFKCNTVFGEHWLADNQSTEYICTMDQFYSAIVNLLPVDWDQECSSAARMSQQKLYSLILFVVLFVCACLIK